MKRRPVIYLRRAQQDLAGIQKYIEQDSPAQARAWLERLDQVLERLSRFPESGVLARDRWLAARGYRMVVVGEHLAFYVLRGRRVEVRRVLHGRQRYSFLLQD